MEEYIELGFPIYFKFSISSFNSPIVSGWKFATAIGSSVVFMLPLRNSHLIMSRCVFGATQEKNMDVAWCCKQFGSIWAFFEIGVYIMVYKKMVLPQISSGFILTKIYPQGYITQNLLTLVLKQAWFWGPHEDSVLGTWTSLDIPGPWQILNLSKPFEESEPSFVFFLHSSYPLVNVTKNYGKTPCLKGKSTINSHFQ